MVGELSSTAEYFISALQQIIGDIERTCDADQIIQLLAIEQDFAIKLGTMIEGRIGEGTDAVAKLEELCEVIYQTGEVVGLDDYGEKFKRMHELVSEIEDLVSDLHLCREVVFLPYRRLYWDTLKGLCQSLCDQDDINVHVIPIPYYDKLPSGDFGDDHYEGESFIQNVNITDYREYRIEERFPDIIIIQNVQENSNYALSVHPDYYAERLKTFTPNLVYVSPFTIDELGSGDERGLYSLRFFVTVPGMVYVDKIIVQSRKMKDIYIKELTDLVGEETGCMWEEKVDTIDSLMGALPENEEYKISATEQDNISVTIPEAWTMNVVRKDGKRKKVILFRTTISTLLRYKGRMIDKLKSIFETFADNKESVVVVWKPDPEMDKVRDYDPELWQEYQEVVAEYKSNGIGIYDDSQDDGIVVSIADAYYGDPCVIATRIRRLGKPVMIMNVLV